jgi:hypothetical protein
MKALNKLRKQKKILAAGVLLSLIFCACSNILQGQADFLKKADFLEKAGILDIPDEEKNYELVEAVAAVDVTPLPNKVYRITLYLKNSDSAFPVSDFLVNTTPDDQRISVVTQNVKVNGIGQNETRRAEIRVNTGAASPGTYILQFAFLSGRKDDVLIGSASVQLSLP